MNVINGMAQICAAMSSPPVSKGFAHKEIREGKLKVFKMGASTVTTPEYINEYHQLLIDETAA